LALAVVGMLAATGCKSNLIYHGVQLDSRAGIFDTASISYEIDSSRLGEPLPVARIEGQLVSYDQQATAPLPGSAVGKLTIVYPHPDKKPGLAQARLEIKARTGGIAPKSNSPPAQMIHSVESGLKSLQPWPRNDEIEEVWLLDLPKAEVDALVHKLDDSGYFKGKGAGRAGIEIATVVDGAGKKRRWDQVPELDALMVQVRTTGRLESYRRPQQIIDHQPKREYSSVAAYRRAMQANDPTQPAAANNPQLAQAPPFVPPQAPPPAGQPGAGNTFGYSAPSYLAAGNAAGAPANTAPQQGYSAPPEYAPANGYAAAPAVPPQGYAPQGYAAPTQYAPAAGAAPTAVPNYQPYVAAGSQPSPAYANVAGANWQPVQTGNPNAAPTMAPPGAQPALPTPPAGYYDATATRQPTSYGPYSTYR
jgi:hypothetical protein